MKPVTTWIVLANARHAGLLTHSGVGKGLHVLETVNWQAEDAPLPRDKAGVGHSIAGPGVSAVSQTDLQAIADVEFARQICDDLQRSKAQNAFDRLIIAAGPHMLGLLRASMGPDLQNVVVGEISKDLSSQPLKQIADCLGEIIAV